MNQSINSLVGATHVLFKMGDKTPMFNAFNINFYRAGLEDADANITFIQYCTRNHFHGPKRVHSKSR